MPVLIDNGLANDAVNCVAIRYCAVKRFQQHQSAPLTTHEAIRPRIKCINIARWGQHIRTGKGNEGARVQHAIDTAGKGNITGAHAQMTHRLIECHQR